jgi:hypothetical protein
LKRFQKLCVFRRAVKGSKFFRTTDEDLSIMAAVEENVTGEQRFRGIAILESLQGRNAGSRKGKRQPKPERPDAGA